ncbi:(-)-germacrene d synthase [Quercus suber]|uniref:(-)-germacrene d synthase n=1 Tax=Quercus suber TaxID=58331 RepID=A0AAW0LTJ0_QUESU
MNAWKDINKECIRPIEVPVPLFTRVVNLARVMDLLYKDEDAYTHLGGVMVEGITSMLVDPVPEAETEKTRGVKTTASGGL